MHPTIHSILDALPDRYCTKAEFAVQLAKILRIKPSMSWRKQVYRWLNYKRTPKGWQPGTIVYTPHKEVLEGMERWLRPPFVGIWMDLCMLENGFSLKIEPQDKAEVERLCKAGFARKQGRWLSLTKKGIEVRDSISC